MGCGAIDIQVKPLVDYDLTYWYLDQWRIMGLGGASATLPWLSGRIAYGGGGGARMKTTSM